MNRFPHTWLELRAEADAKARSRPVLRALQAWCEERDALSIADLGAGSGANLCWLAPRLPNRQAWHLLDQDTELLSAFANTNQRNSVRTEAIDFTQTGSFEAFGDSHLVTASAFLDLVSAAWFESLAASTRTRGQALYLALSVDGRWHLDPALPCDAWVQDLFTDHQTRNKGFGPALGASAPTFAASHLRALGYTVVTGRSDWCLGAKQVGLQSALIEGWQAAASEQDPDKASRVKAWADRRLEAVAKGDLQLRVGHRDIFAWL